MFGMKYLLKKLNDVILSIASSVFGELCPPIFIPPIEARDDKDPSLEVKESSDFTGAKIAVDV